MKRMPTLASIMTPFPYSIDEEAPVLDAERLMRSRDIHHLPVTRAAKLVSVLSIRDVELVISPFINGLAAEEVRGVGCDSEADSASETDSEDDAEHQDSSHKKPGWVVKDLCKDNAYIVDIHELITDVLKEMSIRHIDSALVTKHGRLAGIITHSDVCRRFSDMLNTWFPDGGDDVVA